MHEMSLIKNLLEKIEGVARENGAQKIFGVKVQLGALCHMSASHFKEHFDEEAQGTIAANATLDIDIKTDESDPHAQDIILLSVEVEQ